MNCLNCGKETKNPKFCSRSCSATYNNKKIGARHGDPNRYKCPICGNKKDHRSKTCHICFMKKKYDKVIKKPIKSFFTGSHLHPRFRYNHIRKWAKLLLESWNIEKVCKRCGYDLHVEACHIKPISEFDENEPMGNVNNKENLIYLCRNCHWEFDNGYLKDFVGVD